MITTSSCPMANCDDNYEYIENSHNALIMTGYSPNTTLTTTTQPEIVNVIQQLSIEIEVINKALDIYYQINNIKINVSRTLQVTDVVCKNKSVKGTRKLRLLFYCVFMAYNKIDRPVDPCYVADIVHLNRKEIEQALNEYSPSGLVLIEPEKMVRFYIKRINEYLCQQGIYYNNEVVEQGVRDVIKICRSNPMGKEWIENTSAKIVAVTALYFYLNDIKGFDISKDINLFEQACYLSTACIRRYYEQISKYYNYDPDIVRSKTEIVLPY